jgi:hypothetical protein
MIRDETDIQEKDLKIIEGEFVTITQSTVRNVEGGHVEMQQVGALSIDGERIEATQGAALMVRGEEINLNQSISGITVADNTSISFSLAPMALSKLDTNINRSAAGIVAGRTVRADKSAALFVLARDVEGELTTLFDWKSAAAAGAVIGGLWGLFALFRRR